MIELNKIYNEDCLEGMKRITDGSVDCIVTSPPYNFCLRVKGNKYIKKGKNEVMAGLAMNKYTNGLSDSLDMNSYFEWQCKCIDEMLRVCSGNVFYNIQMITGNKQALLKIMGRYSESIRDILIWDKKVAEPAMKAGCLNSEYEWIIAFENGDCKGRMFKTLQAGRGEMSNVIRIGKNRENEHRAAFPVQLPQCLISQFTSPGSLILDPFMGSGTTAIAAIRAKRNFIGFELNKEYYDKACKRIKLEQAQLTLF